MIIVRTRLIVREALSLNEIREKVSMRCSCREYRERQGLSRNVVCSSWDISANAAVPFLIGSHSPYSIALDLSSGILHYADAAGAS